MDQLRYVRRGLLVRVSAPAQIRLHLGLDHLDHVLDEAVQFIGRTATGPLQRAIELNTYSEFLARFGDDGGATSSVARYVRLFFLNGGTKCFVIRIADGAVPSGVTLQTETGAAALVLAAKNPGTVGDLIRTTVTYNTGSPEATFNLEVKHP